MTGVYGDLTRIERVDEPSDGLEDFFLLVSIEEPVELRFQQLETNVRSAIGYEWIEKKLTLRRNAEANVTNMKWPAVECEAGTYELPKPKLTIRCVTLEAGRC